MKVTNSIPDCVTLDDSSSSFRALMPCGHAIGSDSMAHLLKSLIKGKDYVIKCPGSNALGKQCNTVWPFDLCEKIAVLDRNEK
jgi:hypothetical protein